MDTHVNLRARQGNLIEPLPPVDHAFLTRGYPDIRRLKELGQFFGLTEEVITYWTKE
jgi:hypothetical protein